VLDPVIHNMERLYPQREVVLGEKHMRTLWAKARHTALWGGRGSAKSWSVATYLSLIAV